MCSDRNTTLLRAQSEHRSVPTCSDMQEVPVPQSEHVLEIPDPAPPALSAVGIDMGIAAFATLSDGTSIAPANHGKAALRGASPGATQPVAQEARQPQPAQGNPLCGRSTAAGGECPQGFSPQDEHDHRQKPRRGCCGGIAGAQHVPSAKGTADAPGRNVRAKAHLNRAILDQGWRGFRTMLGYKLADRGGRLIEVSAAYTSQTCAACGVIDARGRRDQSHFACVACGHEADADANAAINILRRGGHRVEACGGAPQQAAR
jgi:putative transposase